MGCGYVKKLDIKTKDIDLSGEITKPHSNEAYKYFIIAPQKEADQFVNIEKFNFRNLEKSNSSNQISEKKFSKTCSLINVNELNFSGPIISLLKNKVDNYQKNILSNKSLIANGQTNFYKEN